MGHAVNIQIRRTMDLSSVIPANETKESVFPLRNFPSREHGSNPRPLAPEASGLPLSYHAFLPRYSVNYFPRNASTINACTHPNPQFMVMAETSTFGIFRGLNVRGRNVRALTSVAEMSYIPFNENGPTVAV